MQFHGRLVRNWCGSFGVIYSRKRVHRDTKLLLISSLALVPNLHCLWAAFTISIDFCKLPNYKEKDIKKEIIEKEATAKQELATELFEAKINGILDRIYANKMAYEISIITTNESQLIKSTNDETLKDALNESYDSLETLYSKFNDFSETK